MPTELPRNWVKTTLAEIVQLSHKRVLPADAPSERYVGLEHIAPQTMRLLGHSFGGQVRSSSGVFSKGNVLYGKMRPYLNKVWVAEFDGLCSAEFLVFRVPKGVSNRFLAFRLNAEDFVMFANGRVTGERPRVDFSKLGSFAILLPPTPEQERIADKLEISLSRLERATTAARRARNRVGAYRHSVFNAAVEGRLTTDWRRSQARTGNEVDETGASLLHHILTHRRRAGQARPPRLPGRGKFGRLEQPKEYDYNEPIVPSGILGSLPRVWTWATVDQLSLVVQYGTSAKTNENSNGVPVLRMGNIIDGIIDYGHLRFLPNDHHEFPELFLERGDLLFNRTNSLELVGKSAVYHGEKHPCSFASYLIRVRFVESFCSELAEYFLNSEYGRRWALSVATQQVGQANVNGSKLRCLALPLPPQKEQREIVDRVQRRMMAARQLIIKLDEQLTRSIATRQSFLSQAFTGRLVPQNVDDEPASVVLERNRAQDSVVHKLRKSMPTSKTNRSNMRARRPLLDVLRECKKPITPEHLFRLSGYERAYSGADTPQEIIDAFYEELRRLTAQPAKVIQRENSKQQVTLTMAK